MNLNYDEALDVAQQSKTAIALALVLLSRIADALDNLVEGRAVSEDTE